LNSVRIFFGRLTLLWAHLGGTLSKLFLKRSNTKTLVRWPWHTAACRWACLYLVAGAKFGRATTAL